VDLRGQLGDQTVLIQQLIADLQEAHQALKFYRESTHHVVDFFNQQYMSQLYAKLKRAGPRTRIIKFGMRVPPQFWKYIDVPTRMSFTKRVFSSTMQERTAKLIKISKKPGKLSILNVTYKFIKKQNGRKLF